MDKVLALEKVSKRAHLRPRPRTHVPLRRRILWCLFGMSGWWAYNSIMAELPIFVATLPGHERIGSVMVLCTQVGAVLTVAVLNPLREWRSAGSGVQCVPRLQRW